jgi:pectate lyase
VLALILFFGMTSFPTIRSRALSDPLPIFLGAVGFGTDTIGGRGGVVIRVNTLADNSYPLVNNPDGTKSGSLRSALAYNGPRIIVFEVSGYITLNSAIRITSPYATVAGQSAPSPGICIRGDCVVFKTHDILIKDLAFRPGQPKDHYGDAIGVYGSNSASSPYVYNIVIDHCSLTWGIDENSDTWYDWVSNITYSNDLFAQGLLPHSMGLLIGAGFNKVTLYRNVFAQNQERGPRVEAGISHDAYLVMVNNLSYNLKYEQTYVSSYSDSSVSATKPVHITSVNNEMIDGPDSNRGIYMYKFDSKSNYTLYTSGDEHYPYLSSSPTGAVAQSRRNVKILSSPDFDLSQYMIEPASNLKTSLMATVGSRPADRDPVDQAILDTIGKGTGDYITTPTYTTLQENHSAFPLPSNPHGDDNGDGYTNVEEVLHQMAAKVEGR